MRPGPDYHEKLLDALLDVPAFGDPLGGPANRTMLLHRLPKGPVVAIPRFPAPLTDLNSIARNPVSRVIRCQFIFPGKNAELTPDFPPICFVRRGSPDLPFGRPEVSR